MEKWEIEYHQNCYDLQAYEDYCEQEVLEFLTVCDQLKDELVLLEEALVVGRLGV